MVGIVKKLRDQLLHEGVTIQTSSWQGTKSPPAMIEILHVSEKIPMLDNAKDISDAVNAKQPWANIHFKERVGGVPMNPDPSHIMWASSTTDYLADGEKFSHTYSERLWSKDLHSGIRYDIADLNTLVQVLIEDPDTRQAYLPMFFPEDLSASLLGERVPCSLGWHFIIRNGKMDCFYPMRSCDAMRHLHNDLYFANKLVLWVIEKTGIQVKPGTLHFVATSLHCFATDLPIYEKGLIK